MTPSPSSGSAQDPFAVLGLPPGSGEHRVRARYLELVKCHPPERDPEMFRQIHRAYEAARDPLAIANQLLRAAAEDDQPRPWAEVIDEHLQRPPRLDPTLLLSLGNLASTTKPGDGEA